MHMTVCIVVIRRESRELIIKKTKYINITRMVNYCKKYFNYTNERLKNWK